MRACGVRRRLTLATLRAHGHTGLDRTQFQMFMASQARGNLPRVASLPAQVNNLPALMSPSPPPATQAPAAEPHAAAADSGLGARTASHESTLLGPAEIVGKTTDAVQAICINQVRPQSAAGRAGEHQRRAHLFHNSRARPLFQMEMNYMALASSKWVFELQIRGGTVRSLGCLTWRAKKRCDFVFFLGCASAHRCERVVGRAQGDPAGKAPKDQPIRRPLPLDPIRTRPGSPGAGIDGRRGRAAGAGEPRLAQGSHGPDRLRRVERWADWKHR